MNIINRARIIDYKNIRRKLKNLNLNKMNYYSDFKENIIYYILGGKCYIVKNNGEMQCIILIKNISKQIIYIPAGNNGITFFKLLYLLTKNFYFDDYYLKVKYRSLNVQRYKKYFSFNVIEDIKIMKGYTNILPSDDFCDYKDVNFRVMEINRDEEIRVELQNRIFSDIKGRRELNIDEVKREEVKPGFIKNMCYIIELDGIPGGYGQIIMLDGEYYLVNFGIVPEYRNRGIGYYFLNQILCSCYENGLDFIYLSVDNLNKKALKLYEKAGFKEEYNMLAIKI